MSDPWSYPIIQWQNCMAEVEITNKYKNHYSVSVTNCVVEQAYAFIAVINIIPISIMIHH